MTKKTYASTDYDGCDYITAGKMYEVISDSINKFTTRLDGGSFPFFFWYNSADIGFNNWTRHELTPSEAEAHNAKLEQSKALDELAELDSAEVAGNDAEATPEELAQAGTFSEILPEMAAKFGKAIAERDTPKTFGEWALLPIPLDIMPEGAFRVEYLYDEGGNPVAYRRKPDPVVREVEEPVILNGHHFIAKYITKGGKPDLDSIKMEDIEEPTQ